MKSKKNYLLTILLLLISLTPLSIMVPTQIFAASFTGIDLNQTNSTASSTGDTESSDQVIKFTTATSSTLTEISFSYRTTSTGSTMPSHLNLSSVSLGSVTGLTGWTLDTTNASSGVLKMMNASGEYITSSSSITVGFNSITNPYIGDCNSSATYYDTCYVQIVSVDNTSTSIDNVYASYNLQAIPSMSFSVSGVASGVITNGIQTTQSTTATNVGFGDIAPGDVSYAAQELTVTTNADAGYNVYVKTSSMTGVYSGKVISPFAATGASWTTPVAWSIPTGTTPGTNTGWLGINTSDIRVSGWSSGGAEFAPADGNMDLIMQNTGPDTNKNIYITYALGVNVYQPADQYTGSLEYYVIPTY